MRFTDKLAPNYKLVDIECCSTCEHDGIDEMGVNHCEKFPYDLNDGKGKEYILLAMTDWNGKCDFYERKKEEEQ